MNKIFLLPDLGEGLAEAIVRELYVKEGDIVEVDQPLAAMETDKALVDIPSPFQGKILKLHGKINDTIKTDGPFIVFELEGNEKEPAVSETVVGTMEHSEQQVDFTSSNTSNSFNSLLTPKAWSLLEKYDLTESFLTEHFSNHTKISANTLQGKIIELGLAKKKHSSAGQGFDSIRHAMFNTITQAHNEVAPVSLFDSANISLWSNEEDFTVRIIKAIAKAIDENPIINSYYDSQTHSLKMLKEINCGIAMDSKHGLYVPVLNDIAKLQPSEIRECINKHKESVNSKLLKKEDTLGSTILLSNFGVFGAKYATPMVVPPMVAIVGLGQAHKHPIVTDDNNIVVAKLLPLSLTVDHRIITGGEATRFLSSLVKYLELETI